MYYRKVERKEEEKNLLKMRRGKRREKYGAGKNKLEKGREKVKVNKIGG